MVSTAVENGEYTGIAFPVNAVAKEQVDAMIEEYKSRYDIVPEAQTGKSFEAIRE